jgi:hypothetical protein
MRNCAITQTGACRVAETDPETGGLVFRLPPRGLGTADIKRPGYPWIDDPEHPLYAAQQACWPDHTPEQAMREAVLLKRDAAPQRANSASHPAFAADYIANAHAERPGPPVEASQQPPGRTRR